MPDLPRTKWVIDRLMAERAHPTGRPPLVQALRELGHEVVEASYTPGTNAPDTSIPLWEGECVVAYGSHQFVRQLTRARAGMWQPGAFHRCELLSYSVYGAHFGDLMLNDDFVILPFGEFRRRGVSAWGGAAFVRPDSVTKSFTGFVVTERDFGHETNALEKLSMLQPEDPVAMASPRCIAGEFRFIVSDRKVVTGSAYSWDRRLDVRSDVHQGCLELAQEVASRDWQPDRVYTCDVALEDRDGREVPRLLELNAFSCSGLYACDTQAVARAVSLAAAKEWAGLD